MFIALPNLLDFAVCVLAVADDVDGDELGQLLGVLQPVVDAHAFALHRPDHLQ
jgi:hypothetical protein